MYYMHISCNKFFSSVLVSVSLHCQDLSIGRYIWFQESIPSFFHEKE